MPTPRRRLGDAGEARAATFLQAAGYTILDRQVTARVGEIDLVARDGDELVFVEVKTRRSTAFGYPEASVTPKKLHALAQSAQRYLLLHHLHDVPFRFDVIAILLRPGDPEILHLKNVQF